MNDPILAQREVEVKYKLTIIKKCTLTIDNIYDFEKVYL